MTSAVRSFWSARKGGWASHETFSPTCSSFPKEDDNEKKFSCFDLTSVFKGGNKMNRTLLLSFFAIMVFCFYAAAHAQTFDTYITAADIEKVTGLKDVKLSQSSQHGLAGSLHFKNKEGKTILGVKFNNAAFYNKSEAAKVIKVMGDIKGIGEDAFYGADFSDSPNYLRFKKGKYSVELAAFINSKDVKPYLDIEQLKALARIIASRM
jgi:hypothetical protein